MNISGKHVIAALALLIGVWLGNILYYNSHILEKPLFLKHYYDVRSDMHGFELSYIDNINEKIQIVDVSFPELTEDYISFNNEGRNSDGRYYVMRILRINLYSGGSDNIPDSYKNKLITKLKVEYSDGTNEVVDVGKIYLYRDQPKRGELITFLSGGRGKNSGEAVLEAGKDLKVTDINCVFPELINDVLWININGKPFSEVEFPIYIKAGDRIKIDYEFKFREDDIRKDCLYEFPINVYAEDSSGNKGMNNCFIRYKNNFPENVDINALREKYGPL